MSRTELLEMTRSLVAHAKAGTMELADNVVSIPASTYTDEEVYRTEIEKIFKRVPLLLAPSCELREIGSYKAMDVAGVPILVTRDKDGKIRALLNSCTHRGNPVANGQGVASRFTCGYHGWTFKNTGELMGIASPDEFGDVDKTLFCLKEFPSLERAGLIWAILDPESILSIETFLSGYDRFLEQFGFEDWTLFEKRELVGPNWKTAYDGYLDYYHLPVLHGQSFGTDMYHRANYYAWGPHQRVVTPQTSVVRGPANEDPIDLAKIDESDWPEFALVNGVWTIFPHVSIASFFGGNVRGVMLSQLFPGPTVEENITYQYYMMEKEPTDPEVIQGAHEQFDLLKHVVRDEDYATGKRQHEALMSGMIEKVYFGRNEGGGQTFHRWVKEIVESSDEELGALFEKGLPQKPAL